MCPSAQVSGGVDTPKFRGHHVYNGHIVSLMGSMMGWNSEWTLEKQRLLDLSAG